ILRCSSLHMNHYAPPRALSDANLVIFNIPSRFIHLDQLGNDISDSLHWPLFGPFMQRSAPREFAWFTRAKE
ncbi:MAG: hypothetical protein ACREUR_07805, partial [Nitrosospira sp.]